MLGGTNPMAQAPHKGLPGPCLSTPQHPELHLCLRWLQGTMPPIVGKGPWHCQSSSHARCPGSTGPSPVSLRVGAGSVTGWLCLYINWPLQSPCRQWGLLAACSPQDKVSAIHTHSANENLTSALKYLVWNIRLYSQSIHIITRNFNVTFVKERKERAVGFFLYNFKCYTVLNGYKMVLHFLYHVLVWTKISCREWLSRIGRDHQWKSPIMDFVCPFPTFPWC